jgi:hypothetical protein
MCGNSGRAVPRHQNVSFRALWKDLGVRHVGLLISKIAAAPADKLARLRAAGIQSSTVIAHSFDLRDPDTLRRRGHRSAHRQTAVDGKYRAVHPAGLVGCEEGD